MPVPPPPVASDPVPHGARVAPRPPELGRVALLIAGPVLVAVAWGVDLVPAWTAGVVGAACSLIALGLLLRLRRAEQRLAAGLDDGARVLVVGGGYAGLVAARALQARLPGGTRGGRHLGPGGIASGGIARVSVVDPQAHMTYQPFLPEAVAGAIEPRHLTVPLRRALRRCDVVTGAVAAIDDAGRRAVVVLPDGGTREIPYDVLVVAPGSAPRVLPIPGLAERAFGFRTVTDALALREHVLSRLDAAASTSDPAQRRRLLTFVVVGGGFAGLEALGELEDMTRRAARHQPGYVADEVRWVLLEASKRIMPEVGAPLAARVHAQLVRRGIDVRVGASIVSAEDGRVLLAGGAEFACDTVVVAAGSVPNPLLGRTDLPLDPRGRLRCTTTLQVRDRAHVFSAGDCAAVPDVTSEDRDATTAPTAQHAVRQARLLARNVDAHLRRRMLRGYRHQNAGCVAGLGRRRGAAQIGPLRFTGFPAWVLHRAYHLWAMPTADRTIRIALDWLISGVLGRDLVAVGRRDTPPVPDEVSEPSGPAVERAVESAPQPDGLGPDDGDVPTPTTTWGAPADEPHPSSPVPAVPAVPAVVGVPVHASVGEDPPTWGAPSAFGAPVSDDPNTASMPWHALLGPELREPHPSAPLPRHASTGRRRS